MLRDAWLMARKDLRIEMGSRVVLGQVLPFGILILILFGLAISPELAVIAPNAPTGGLADRRSVLSQVAPGLFWIAVLLSALMALNRSFLIESQDGKFDALKMAGLDPAGIFLGKALAVIVQLLFLEIALGIGAAILYQLQLADAVLLATALILATTAVTSAGTLYTALASGLQARDTLVPLLVLPVLAPVLLAATLATESAIFGPSSDGWPWALLLGVFTLLYVGIGIVSFGPIMEET